MSTAESTRGGGGLASQEPWSPPPPGQNNITHRNNIVGMILRGGLKGIGFGFHHARGGAATRFMFGDGMIFGCGVCTMPHVGLAYTPGYMYILLAHTSLHPVTESQGKGEWGHFPD